MGLARRRHDFDSTFWQSDFDHMKRWEDDARKHALEVNRFLGELLKRNKKLIRETLELEHKLSKDKRKWNSLKNAGTFQDNATQELFENKHWKNSGLVHLIAFVGKHASDAWHNTELVLGKIEDASYKDKLVLNKLKYGEIKKEIQKAHDELWTVLKILNGRIMYNRLRTLRLTVREFSEHGPPEKKKHFTLNLRHGSNSLTGEEKAIHRLLKTLFKHATKAMGHLYKGDYLIRKSQADLKILGSKRF